MSPSTTGSGSGNAAAGPPPLKAGRPNQSAGAEPGSALRCAGLPDRLKPQPAGRVTGRYKRLTCGAGAAGRGLSTFSPIHCRPSSILLEPCFAGLFAATPHVAACQRMEGARITGEARLLRVKRVRVNGILQGFHTYNLSLSFKSALLSS